MVFGDEYFIIVKNKIFNYATMNKIDMCAKLEKLWLVQTVISDSIEHTCESKGLKPVRFSIRYFVQFITA